MKIMEKENQYFPQSHPHPGETLQEKLDEMGLGPKEFSALSVIPETTVVSVLRGQSPVTLEMATIFQGVTGIPAAFWIENQRRHDESRKTK